MANKKTKTSQLRSENKKKKTNVPVVMSSGKVKGDKNA